MLKKPFNLFYLLSFLVLAIVLVHVLALFGIAIIVVYVFCWFFIRNRTICLVCYNSKLNAYCPLCKRVKKSTTLVVPASLASAALNVGLLLLLTLLSVAIINTESFILHKFNFVPTKKTAHFNSEKSTQYKTLEVFPYTIVVNSTETAINTVESNISFDPSALKALSIDVSNSFATIFVTTYIDNSQGLLRIAGGLPSPGYIGDKGVFATVYFQAIKPGTTELVFLPSSQIMADDNRGTNILREYTKIPFLISGEEISMVDKKRQEQQYPVTKVLGAQNTKLMFVSGYESYPPISQVGSSSTQTNLLDWALSQLDAYCSFVLSLWRFN